MTSVSCASITLCVAADKSGDVTAFTALAADRYTLSVRLAGEGTVESNPAGMLCGSEQCEGQFAGPVTLTASASSGYVFAGWLGCRTPDRRKVRSRRDGAERSDRRVPEGRRKGRRR